MKKKLTLDSLKVQSFITDIEGETIKGAGTQLNCNTWYSATQCIRTKDCTLDPSQCIAIEVSGLCSVLQSCLTGTGPM